MKKDIYNGKVKKELISIITFSIVLFGIVSLGLAIFFLLFALLFNELNNDVLILTFVLSALCFIMAIVYPPLTIYLYRSYPKHPKLTKLFTNSSALIDLPEDDSKS